MEKLFPFGVFTKSNLRDIGLLGKNQLEYFVKTGKMLRVKDRDDLISKLPSEYKDYLSKIDELASYYTPLIEQLEDEYFEALDRYLEENPDFQERYAELSYEEGEALLKTVNDLDFVNASNNYNNAMAEWIKKDAAISKEARRFVTQWLKENGYDSVEVANDVGSQGRTTDATILLNPAHVKSLELVTYDDNGKIIPLSQRFDETNNDVRFSISDTTEKVEEFIADNMNVGVKFSVPTYLVDMPKFEKWTRGKGFIGIGEVISGKELLLNDTPFLSV